MKVRYSPYFYKRYQKVDVRIRNSIDQKIALFTKNPNDPELNNHSLREPYKGLRSIDVTVDWRALYQELVIEEDIVAYFVALGTHDQLYGKSTLS